MPDKSRPPPIRNHLLAALTGEEFEMKREFMAMMLGVTRSVVTRAAGRLQKEKVIRYTRGRVTVLDRGGLEATACECYGAVRAEYARNGNSLRP